MIQYKKTLSALIAFLFPAILIFLTMFFLNPDYVVAASSTVSFSCGDGHSNTCTTSGTVNLTSSITTVKLEPTGGGGSCDQCANIVITKPDGSSSSYSCSIMGGVNIPGGMYVAGGSPWIFDKGLGAYQVTVTDYDKSPMCYQNGVAVFSNFGFVLSDDPLPSCTISASPDALMPGETATLNWTINNATSATLNGTALAGGDFPSGSKSGVSAGAHSIDAVDLSGNHGTCSVNIATITPPTGGLVPCGRLADDPATTDINEASPCDLCAVFYMLKNMFNIALADIAIPAGVLLLIASGILYAFSAGNPRRVQQAKTILFYTLLGFAIMFVAWIIVAFLLKGMGYSDITTWNQVNCVLQK